MSDQEQQSEQQQLTFISNYNQEIEDFDDMGLDDELLRGLTSVGFEFPSKIQKLAIAPMIAGKDVIAQSQSGTGKTATFVTSVLQNIDPSIKKVQGLILSPVRELADQTYDFAMKVSRFMKGVTICNAIGGITSVDDNLKKIHREGAQIIIGTPGRVLGLLDDSRTRNYGDLSLEHLKIFAIDEADEMLSQGFIEQVVDIFKRGPSDVQVCLVSATLPPEILAITDTFMRDPIRILVPADELTLKGIQQYYIAVDNQWKFQTLNDLYANIEVQQSVIFVNRKIHATTLHEKLLAMNWPVAISHGDMTPQERELVLQKFRNCEFRILITTDLLARGIDVQQVSLVFNYDVPTGDNARETYLHRIGRSGRYGRKGFAINFVTPNDYDFIISLEKHYECSIAELPGNIGEIIAKGAADDE
eukprot:TRINITY_DN3018_c0_g1_i1.p2 TRINITY_DN3018_c0_g1~~TRINITY_DN3018_c0_g1_i1.p2  ORF type:complete len:425 (+),score=125.58 TRINITY_DN3018_c0_g1_i1:27-1277(+)